MLTLTNLRYLRRLVQTYGAYEERTLIDEKLAVMIGVSKGGETMAGKKKSAAKPSKPTGKMKKK